MLLANFLHKVQNKCDFTRIFFSLSLLPSAAHCLLVQESKSSSTLANQRELHWVQTPAPGPRALRMTLVVGNASSLTLRDINCCNIHNSCERWLTKRSLLTAREEESLTCIWLQRIRSKMCEISPSGPEMHKRCFHGFIISVVHPWTLKGLGNEDHKDHIFLHFSISSLSLPFLEQFTDLLCETSGAQFCTIRHDKALSWCVSLSLYSVHHFGEVIQYAFFGLLTRIWPGKAWSLYWFEIWDGLYSVLDWYIRGAARVRSSDKFQRCDAQTNKIKVFIFKKPYAF